MQSSLEALTCGTSQSKHSSSCTEAAVAFDSLLVAAGSMFVGGGCEALLACTMALQFQEARLFAACVWEASFGRLISNRALGAL